MGYRRSESCEVESSRWRSEHRSFLAECGIPPEVYNSDRAWVYVLLHGSDDFGTGWEPSWISRQQAEKLLAFLECEVKPEMGLDLLRRLRARIEE